VIRVSGEADSKIQIYTNPLSGGNTTESAWLYGLQAAKTSVTVYCIWLGHVYQWHNVPAALIMTLQSQVSEKHSLRTMADPMSKYLVGFNTLLLLLWPQTSPPTSISSATQYLDISNTFAVGRSYYDDDPLNALARNNIEEADFSLNEPWDKYPVVKDYLQVWDATKKYVSIFVDQSYTDDSAVTGDKELQDWITAAGNPDGGNIKGLPTIHSKASLKEFITSFIYRITVHGMARLSRSSQPHLTFVANFPPCLQRDNIPAPDSQIDTKELLKYLPNTGTIGSMLNFYMVFAFSTPYEPFVPMKGYEKNLFFGDDVADPRNQALIKYRKDLTDFMNAYQDDKPQTFQWPLSVES